MKKNDSASAKTPLSRTQLGIYFASAARKEGEDYSIRVMYHLDDDIDAMRLKDAAEKLVAARPVLNSRVVKDEAGTPCLEQLPAPFEVGVSDVDSIDPVRKSICKPADLDIDPLCAMDIFRTKEGNWFHVNFSHLVMDGTSYNVFMEELSAIYDGNDVAEESFTNADVALREIEARKGDAFGEARAFYESEFGGIEAAEAPLPDIDGSDDGAFVKIRIPLTARDADVKAACTRHGVSRTAFFNTAFGLQMMAYTAEQEALFTTVFNGRDSLSARTCTMAVQTLPVHVAARDSIAEMLELQEIQTRAVRSHTCFSFAEVCESCGIRMGTTFVYQGNASDVELVLCGRSQRKEDLRLHEPGMGLCFQLCSDAGGYSMVVEYPSGRYSREMMEEMAECFDKILAGMLTCEKVGELDICPEKSVALLDSFEGGALPEDSDQTVISLFRKAAADFRDNVAVVFKEKSLTYGELDELTDRIAAYISSKVKRDGEPVVSIIVSRSEMMAVLPLAAMKAGCAYQPLDPSYPKERLNFMVKDAASSLLIADGNLRELVDGYDGEVLLTEQIASLPAAAPGPDGLNPSSLFILLYTSGSTGVPKGVMLEHRNLVAFCNWYHRYYDLRPEHRVAAYASFGFDACMMDLYPALTCGASVVIVPEELRLDLVSLGGYMADKGVTHSFMTTQVGVQFMQNVDTVPTLKHLSVGGEKLVSVDPPAGYAFHNGYGPTECTIFSTTMQVLRKEGNIPIGRPTDALHCRVCDRFGHRLPIGAAGELIICGRQVGRGYLNLPDKTAEAFFMLDGERAYRSGDIVRYRRDGNIEFIGRRDGQVKIRGFRIELKEVEAVIREFEGIDEVTVQAFDDPAGGKFIAAYVVSPSPVDIKALNAFILDRKPPYMVPAVTMQIDRIPLNVNQKVDRKALPKPEVKGAAGAERHAAPLNMLEQELKEMISPIVGIDDFDITDTLGSLGLTSLSSLKLAMMIYKRFGVQTDSRTLSRTATLQSVENDILAAMLSPKEAEQPQERPCEPAAETDEGAPLSFPQQGVYTECVSHPESVIYNIPFSVAMPAGTDAAKLGDALHRVVALHPALNFVFVPSAGGDIVQRLRDDQSFDIPALKMSEEEFAGHKAAFVQPFDLGKGPLFRFETVELPQRLMLLMDMHHLVCDGASVDIFLKDLCDALDGRELHPEELSYGSFSRSQAIDPESEAFFDSRMSIIEESSRLIPDIYEGTKEQRKAEVEHDIDLDALSKAAKEAGVTPAAFCLAASLYTVGAYLYEDTVSMCTISNGRSDLRTGSTMGMFVNTLPLTTTIDRKMPSREFVQQTAEMFTRTLENEQYPFSRIASRFDFVPNISYAYQVDVTGEYSTSLGALDYESLELDLAKIPVAVSVEGRTGERCFLKAEYDTSLYSEDMMRSLLRSIANTVSSLGKVETLGDVSLTVSEQWKVLDSYNPELCRDYDPSDTVVSAFRKVVARYPDHTAAVFKEKSFTYSQLDEMTDRLGAYIYGLVKEEKSAGGEVVVSILIHRNEFMFIASLAALKAGCGYQPLDPSYPQERLNFMVGDASAKLLIADEDLVDIVNEYKGKVLLTRDMMALSEHCDTSVLAACAPAPGDLFTMLYTSGSTGVPKGCMIEHRNLVPFAAATHICLEQGPESHIATYASFGFDVNMMDMYCSFLNGATLYVIPEEMRMDLESLHGYMEECGITQIFLTTQVGVQFLENYPVCKGLKHMAMGGEKLRAVSPENLSYTIYNGYGPSETTCGCSLFPIRHWEPNIPIGKPINSMLCYVVDKSGHRLPIGAAGELWICSAQVARGYLNRPEKTAEAFSDNPFGEGRVYHSGDIVRYRANGDIEFVGRKDGQVKIRGFRIELKEVEAVIREFEGIRDVTVQAFDYDDGGKFIAAYVVADSPIDTDALAAFIKERKPPYMVPAVTMQIEKIPLTVNQKVDKKALPKPEVKAAEYVAPATEAEKTFCEIFQNVLDISKVGATDDFFDIGGSSILALKVVIGAGKAGYSIVYNNVFEYTTPRALAAYATGEAAPAEAPAQVEVASAGPTVGPDGYDYTAIHEMLSRNTLEAFRGGERQELGEVLLAGATGFLGVHVLKDLIDNYDIRINCFVRSKGDEGGEARLKDLLEYYFGDSCEALFGSRLFIVQGDATDPAALSGFTRTGLTVINCAASVKHFARGNEIELTNVESVRNLVEWCLTHDSRLVHVSTASVGGESLRNPADDTMLDEHNLFISQMLDNKYAHSKYMAERLIFEAIVERGLSAKVMRVGNLAARDTDGRFQVNYKSNNFMTSLAAFRMLGKFGWNLESGRAEFSPINKVARTLLLLATTPKECVCFIPINDHIGKLGDVIREMGCIGREVEFVEPEEFKAAFDAALENPDNADVLRPLFAYANSAGQTHYIQYDNSYTVQILGRLGFSWPQTGPEYVQKLLKAAAEQGLFES